MKEENECDYNVWRKKNNLKSGSFKKWLSKTKILELHKNKNKELQLLSRQFTWKAMNSGEKK